MSIAPGFSSPASPPRPGLDAPPLPPPARIARHLSALESGLLERGSVVRLVLLAALAGEHALLIGPPGTAKSELARRLHRVFHGAAYFERLLTRFSTPEELFGPLSLKALEDDRYERLTEGWLPTAGIAFIDEVFKANSAILNALLTLLNEREFDNGSGRRPVPLLSLIGASNELPTDDSLQAFHDRFLLRIPTPALSDASFEALLRLPVAPAGVAADVADSLTAADVAAVATARGAVALPARVVDGLTALRAQAQRLGIAVSDRRWRQLVALMRSAAVTEGRTELDGLDLWLAPYALASEPAHQQALADWFATEWLRAVPEPAPGLERASQAFEQQLSLEQRLPADPAAAAQAGKVALARRLGADGDAEGGDGMLRMVSATLEQRLRRRFSPVHVAARVAQVDEVVQQAQALRDGAAASLQALREQLQGRLWIGPEAAARWCGAHQQTIDLADGLLQRLQATRAGFAALPLDEALPADAPAPLPMAAVPMAVAAD